MPSESDLPRKSRVWLVILLVVGILIACLAAAAIAGLLWILPVRQEITEVADPGDEAPLDEPETAAEAPSAIENETESVAFLIMASSAGWAGHITDVKTTTVLRRPVIVVTTDIGPEQAGLSDELTSALGAFVSGLAAEDGSAYTYHIQVLSSEGDVIGTVGSTDERWRLDVPAAPEDVRDLRAWLDAVYGSGSPEPEAWVGRITAITEGDPEGSIVVRTDLDPASMADQRAAQTIIDAINSSGTTFATGVRVLFADGEFEWSSLLTGTDPYGP